MPTPKAKHLISISGGGNSDLGRFAGAVGNKMWPRSFYSRLMMCVVTPIALLLINVVRSSLPFWLGSDSFDRHGTDSSDRHAGRRIYSEPTVTKGSVLAPKIPIKSQRVPDLKVPLRREVSQSAKVIQESERVWKINEGALSFQIDLGKPTTVRGGDVQHVGEDCWDPNHCGHAGLCAWCGAGNACCREGFGDDPPECKTAQNFKSSHHECVSVAVETYNHASASVAINGAVVLRTPRGGMWSVGRQLHSGWPTEWDFGGIHSVNIVGPWLVAKGSIKHHSGEWMVGDRWRIYDGVLEGFRDWSWAGSNGIKSDDSVLSIRWQTVGGHGSGLLMPGVVYHGNPAGQKGLKNGWTLVPAWKDIDGYRLQVEEHRLAQTWASYEWQDHDEKRSGPDVGKTSRQRTVVALDSQPSTVPYTRHKDVYWTLGAEAATEGTVLQLLSGAVALNREVGLVKSGGNSKTNFTDIGLSMPSGKRIQKRYRLHVGEVGQQGGGFRIPLNWTITRGDLSADGLPRFSSILEAKVRFALSRWMESNWYPGFAMYPGNKQVYVMGWAGQAEAPGYALQVLADRLARPELRTIAHQALDVLSQAEFNEEGFLLSLHGSTGKWSQQDPVSQGQAMSAFARAIRYGRRTGANVATWEDFLLRACKIHAARILSEDWDPRSTAEAFLVQPLALGAGLFQNSDLLSAALKAGDHYVARHIGIAEPFWGGTLDASCEDKEGAWAGFEAFLALHEATGEAKWLEAANYAADFTLTYTYLWDVSLPPGRLRDHDLRTRGWTSVSVQNMHLDVYGVLYTPRLWRLGELAHRPELFHVAELMYRTCGQMIDAMGSQGEQLQQTRFAMAGDLADPERYRGGYVESWTVFWIAAHFLTAAAQFEEMGVLSALWDRR